MPFLIILMQVIKVYPSQRLNHLHENNEKVSRSLGNVKSPDSFCVECYECMNGVKVGSYSTLFTVRCGALSYSSSNVNGICVNAPQRSVNNAEYERTLRLLCSVVNHRP